MQIIGYDLSIILICIIILTANICKPHILNISNFYVNNIFELVHINSKSECLMKIIIRYVFTYLKCVFKERHTSVCFLCLTKDTFI